MQPLLPLQPSNTTAIPKYFSYSVRWTLVPISVGRYLSLQRRFISTANLITGPCFHLHTLLFSTSIYPVLLWYESVLCYFICNRCQIWSDQAMKASTDEFLYVSRICRWLIAFSRLVLHLRFLPPPIRPVVKWFNRVEPTSPICEVLVPQIDSKTPPISSKWYRA